MSGNTVNTQSSFLSKLFWLIPKSLVKVANFYQTYFIVACICVYSFFFIGDDGIELKDKTALVIALKECCCKSIYGTPSENFIRELQGTDVPETQMRDILKAINYAASDNRISVLVLNPDYIWGIGLVDLKELETAVDNFRKNQTNR